MSNKPMVETAVSAMLNLYRSSPATNEEIVQMVLTSIQDHGGFRAEAPSAVALEPDQGKIWMQQHCTVYCDDENDDGVSVYLYCEDCEESINDDITNLNVYQLMDEAEQHCQVRHT